MANALDTAAATNPLWQQVVGATEAQARSAFTSLSNASIHANAAGVLSDQSHYLRDAVTDRLRQDFAYGTPLAPAGNVLSYAAETPRNAYAAARAIPFYKAPPLAAAPTSPQVYAVWAQALGSWGSLKGDGNAAKTDQSLGGVISGMDVTFNGSWRVGLAGGYSQSIFKSPSIAASGSSDSYHIALYGGGQVGAWGLRGGASFSWNDILTSRQVDRGEPGWATAWRLRFQDHPGVRRSRPPVCIRSRRAGAIRQHRLRKCRWWDQRTRRGGCNRIGESRHHLHHAWRAWRDAADRAR